VNFVLDAWAFYYGANWISIFIAFQRSKPFAVVVQLLFNKRIETIFVVVVETIVVDVKKLLL
jgi:hypothetical protein